MDSVNEIVFAITTGMVGNALYDGLKMLFDRAWDRFILLTGDKAKLIEEVQRALELRKDDVIFMANLQILQQHSGTNITTGNNSIIVNNSQVIEI